MNVLLVTPYFGGSHRAWAEGYARHSRHDVHLLTMPARFWKWRMHGGAATLVTKLRERLGQGMPMPDVILATDMVNVPAFLALARDLLADVPVVLYCHENQLTYPLQEGEQLDFAFPMINWLSMLAADQVVFNSAFHLESWFAALPNFLKNFPDMPHTSLISSVREKSQVLPVGVDLARLDAARPDTCAVGEPGAPPLILWNQRWEYDKNPGAFFRALRALVDRDVPFRVALAGANFRQEPEEFEASQAWLGDRLVHYGRASRARYHRLLWEADLVVSTAIHEFFGIAIVEAIYCETFPVLPRRLAYPELLPETVHARCLYQDPDALVNTLAWALEYAGAANDIAEQIRPTVKRFDWREVAPRCDALITGTIHAFSR